MNRSIIERNQYQISKYEAFKKMALERGDTEFANTCDKQIARYKGGVERWS